MRIFENVTQRVYRWSLVFVSMSMLLVLSACEGGTDKAEVREETKEAVEAMKDYAEETQEEYRKAAQERLDNVKAQIQELRDRAANLQQDVGDEIQTSIDTLNRNYGKLEQQLTSLEKTERAKWNDMQAELDKALDDLEEAHRNAAAKLQVQESGGGSGMGSQPKGSEQKASDG